MQVQATSPAQSRAQPTLLSPPLLPLQQRFKISSQLATPHSANIERSRLPVYSVLRATATNSWQTTFHFIKISTRLFRSWNFSHCRLLFLAICLFANCLPVMLILSVGQADVIRFHFSGCLFMPINIIFVSGFSYLSGIKKKKQ